MRDLLFRGCGGAAMGRCDMGYGGKVRRRVIFVA